MRLTSRLGSIVVLVMVAAAWPVSASPYLLFDVGNGKVLDHREAFRRWYPASLTKLMTAYVAFRAVEAGELTLNSPIRMTSRAAAEPPSKMGYKPGSVMTLDNALKMIIIKSANDVAMAIGENIAGSQEQFVERMNAEARRLGMTGTRFANANGLHSEDQFSTARDLALLVRAIRTEFPEYDDYFSIEALSAGKNVIKTYNLLIGRFAGADGMKTGFICPSGFNLIATATRNGRTLAAVVLGAESGQHRAYLAADLLARGFAGGSEVGDTSLELLEPYGERDRPTDMRPIICTSEAAAKRRGESDGADSLVDGSAHMQEMDRPPRTVAVGLGGALGPVPENVPTVSLHFRRIPVPTPRPTRESETRRSASVLDIPLPKPRIQ